MTLSNVQGQGSLVKWVKTSLKVSILAGELMSTSSCIFFSRWGHDIGKPVITIDTSPVVNTTCGYIQGQIENGIYVFKVLKRHERY